MELTTKYQELCQENGFQVNQAQLEIIKNLENFGNLILNEPKKKSEYSFLKHISSFFSQQKNTLLFSAIFY